MNLSFRIRQWANAFNRLILLNVVLNREIWSPAASAVGSWRSRTKTSVKNKGPLKGGDRYFFENFSAKRKTNGGRWSEYSTMASFNHGSSDRFLLSLSLRPFVCVIRKSGSGYGQLLLWQLLNIHLCLGTSFSQSCLWVFALIYIYLYKLGIRINFRVDFFFRFIKIRLCAFFPRVNKFSLWFGGSVGRIRDLIITWNIES